MDKKELNKVANIICTEIFHLVKKEDAPFPYPLLGVDYQLESSVKNEVMFLFDIGLGKKKRAQISFHLERLAAAVQEGKKKQAAEAVLMGFRDAFEKGAFGGKVESINPIRIQKKKVGRNKPCPCGSGKKYKHCCTKKEN